MKEGKSAVAAAVAGQERDQLTGSVCFEFHQLVANTCGREHKTARNCGYLLLSFHLSSDFRINQVLSDCETSMGMGRKIKVQENCVTRSIFVSLQLE